MEFNKHFRYDPETGRLIYRPRKDKTSQWNGRWAGKVAGRISKFGYVRINYEGKHYSAHHIVWYMHHGRWPNPQLDHINRRRADNRIENLRESTQSENCVNRGYKDGRIRGVCKPKSSKGWVAQIGWKGKSIYLGTFPTPEEASEAYKAKSRELYGEYSPFW